MQILKSVKNIATNIVDTMLNILVPEDQKLGKILELDPYNLKLLLPKSPVNMKDVHVLFNYGNKVVKMIVHSIKYKNNLSIKKRIGLYLHEEITDLSSELMLFHGTSPLVIPMPMSKKEKSDRGWNQSEELVKEIERLGNIEVSYNALIKIRETKRQTELTKEERLLNVESSMQAEEGVVKGRIVIVLDDVYTTLATFSEARRALIKSGARRVLGFFIAH